MPKYLAVAKNLLTRFKTIKIEQVGKDLNSHVDALEGWTIVVDLISNLRHEMLQESILVNTELGPS